MIENNVILKIEVFCDELGDMKCMVSEPEGLDVGVKLAALMTVETAIKEMNIFQDRT